MSGIIPPADAPKGLRTAEAASRLASEGPNTLSPSFRSTGRSAPSSPLFRLFVSPVYLVFRDDGRAFRGMLGRLLPVQLKDGKVRPVDGELVADSAVELLRNGLRQPGGV